MNKYAIIDIGSNSVRYAEERDGLLPEKEIYTTRLGSGLSATGRLSDESMEKSLAVMRSLSGRARAGGFIPTGYATSAVRDAENGRGFAERITAECGFPVRILSGAEEARLAFLGASDGGDAGVMLDIGGASMQVVTRDFGVSFRAGCVRCGDIARAETGAADCDDLPGLQRAAVCRYMDGIVELPALDARTVVGVGGTITTLAALRTGLDRFDREAVEATVLTPKDVEELIESLAAMSDGERLRHPLLSERHDVILYGAYVLAYALEKLGAKELLISCSDGMEGYLKKVKDEQ